jgi:hypothetical protein
MTEQDKNDHLWSIGTGAAGGIGVYVGLSLIGVGLFMATAITGLSIAMAVGAGAMAGAGVAVALGTSSLVLGALVLGGTYKATKSVMNKCTVNAQKFRPVSALLSGIGTLTLAFALSSGSEPNAPPAAPETKQDLQSEPLKDQSSYQHEETITSTSKDGYGYTKKTIAWSVHKN